MNSRLRSVLLVIAVLALLLGQSYAQSALERLLAFDVSTNSTSNSAQDSGNNNNSNNNSNSNSNSNSNNSSSNNTATNNGTDTNSDNSGDGSDDGSNNSTSFGLVQFIVPPPSAISTATNSVLFAIGSTVNFTWTYNGLTSPPANVSVRFRYTSSSSTTGSSYYYIANQTAFANPMTLTWDTATQKPDQFNFDDGGHYQLQIFDPATDPDTTNGVPGNFGMLQASYLNFMTYITSYGMADCGAACINSARRTFDQSLSLLLATLCLVLYSAYSF
ncbi:hypothetical protein GQ42DRAFT_171841 [Ramicandelaber brevisporus]|nr:hypothetical protein GQ42DRAFT_171841 [Ramicandelaber brevisporus]